MISGVFWLVARVLLGDCIFGGGGGGGWQNKFIYMAHFILYHYRDIKLLLMI